MIRHTTRPTVGALMVTRDGARFIPDTVECMRAFADRVIVGVDSRTLDNSMDVAGAAGAEVVAVDFRGGASYERALNLVVQTLDTDWVFYLHDDELMSPVFCSRLPDMLHTEHAWRFPHYNLWPDPWHYVITPPLYPDQQLRLIPRWMWVDNGGWPEHVHACPPWPCRVSDLHIWHYKFIAKPMGLRQERLNFWTQEREIAGNDHYRAFSIIEDVLNVAVAPVDEVPPFLRFGS